MWGEARSADISPWLAERLRFDRLFMREKVQPTTNGYINCLLAEKRARDAGECRLILRAHDSSVWAWPDVGLKRSAVIADFDQ